MAWLKNITDENLDARSLEIDNERIRSLQQKIAQESERSNDRLNDREIERG